MKNSAGLGGQSHFAQVPSANIQRSVFSRNFTHKTTFNSGELIPVFWDAILPGDTMSVKAHFLSRLATPMFPIMDNIYFDYHFWFVPNRLVWENWERFNGAQTDPNDSTDFLIPQLEWLSGAGNSEIKEGFLLDYLGLPIGEDFADQDEMPNALLPRACQLIYDEWYRDENWINSLSPPKGDGPDPLAQYQTTKILRGRRKDYFTSCLPWPQKGPSVLLPLGATAPVIGLDQNILLHNSADATDRILMTQSSGSSGERVALASNPSNVGNARWGTTALVADLEAATAATINSLRESFQIQRMFERDARGGTRYTEILLSHFGVQSPDFRLQRPEYLGGGSDVLNVNPVTQTSQSDETPQGTLAAFAVQRGRHGFNHSFVEHGYVIGFVSVRTDYTYQQNIDRDWFRRTRFDFYWPTLAHLGEQAVLNKEIFFTGNKALDNQVFGYQERFGEYRYKPSMVTGQFRSKATLSLDSWHLAFEFTAAAPLLGSFVNEITEIPRVLAVQDPDVPEIIMDSFFSIKHTRPMPTYGVPGLIDHF